MNIRFCRDCTNFEERRDIDGTTLCMKNHEPKVLCEDFAPRDCGVNKRRLYLMSCPECVNFEAINGYPLCAKGHKPGDACEDFIDRFRKIDRVKQNNQIRAVLSINGQSILSLALRSKLDDPGN
ncbi:MAG: hypothetical protein RMJ07_05830 [Nitrososphaerota archaeon]|nr:hypothetical protein [Candidatus Bathyarchaeota archaeon]MDW8049179.1 hypothetical protein [Nitrososphaerota archaeon]